jgi:hypothetical protein
MSFEKKRTRVRRDAVQYLNISMYVPMGMEINKSFENLAQYSCNNRFIKTLSKGRFHYMKARAPGHVWHHNPKTVSSGKRAMCP